MSARGISRTWLIVSAAWITCIAIMGYVAVFLEVPRQFRYVYEVRSDVESWQEGRSPERAPVYDVMRSPSQDKLTPEFRTSEAAYAAGNEWNRHVDEGGMLTYQFFDGTELLLSSVLSDGDREYLVAAFWDGRWERWSEWAPVAAPWIVAALLPPLFLLGALWLGQRFKAL